MVCLRIDLTRGKTYFQIYANMFSIKKLLHEKQKFIEQSLYNKG